MHAARQEKATLSLQYDGLLDALTNHVALPELVSGLACDLQATTKEAIALELAVAEAEILVNKHEQYRRAQVCDLRDEIEDHKDDNATLRQQLDQAGYRIASLEFDVYLREKEKQQNEQMVPQLEARIKELEDMKVEGASIEGPQGHVVRDLKRRLNSQIERCEFSEQYVEELFHELQDVKHNWEMFGTSTVKDFKSARTWRDERDALRIEIAVMKERFAHELLVDPLIVADSMKLQVNQVDDEELTKIEEKVVKQFEITYKAVPQEVFDSDAIGYEMVRAEHMDAEKAKMQAEHDAIRASFLDDSEMF